ncbi:hypothetical protein BC829DRAFT_150373 [Chytridium lagenaria]|nr:hypothetical protein BC829DRAFT_150373 [Chytridium lagenaria]
MAECEHSKTQPIQWNIASVDYNTDCLKEKRSSYSIRSLPVLATSETLSSSGIKIAPEEPRSVFLPLSEPAKYAFLRIGLLSANWSCYWVAASVILLFATLPEASVWSATYYAVPIIVLFTRVLVGSFICAIMDAMSLFIEAKILRVDFADGVKECRVASLSSGAYLHLLGYTISIAGPFIIADALFNSSPTYIAGRRRW